MTLAGPSGIPVPKTIGLCTDEAVNERPFFVMEFVEGHIVRDAPEAEQAFDIDTRGGVGDHMAETLVGAARHRSRRGGAGRPGAARGVYRAAAQAVERAVRPDAGGGRRSRRAGGAGRRRTGRPSPAAAAHIDRARRLPHGQRGARRPAARYGPSSTGSCAPWATRWPTSACSWTIGPTRRRRVGARASPPPLRRASPPGHRSWSTTRASPISISRRIGYYTAFGYWKLACILQGVYARYVAGAGAGDQGSVDAYPAQVGRLAQMASERIGGHPMSPDGLTEIFSVHEEPDLEPAGAGRRPRGVGGRRIGRHHRHRLPAGPG